jgi:nucleoid DNA-binding protein
MINDAKLSFEKGRIINQLSKDENLNYGDFLEKVNEHLSPIQQQLDQEYDRTEMINTAKQFVKGRQPKMGYVFMVNPQTGEPREVLAKDVQAAKAAGGILLNE